jgi:hypothetical protein
LPAPCAGTQTTSWAARTVSLRRTLGDRRRDTQPASPPTASAAKAARAPNSTIVATTSDERLLLGLMLVTVLGRVAAEAEDGFVAVDLCAVVGVAL